MVSFRGRVRSRGIGDSIKVDLNVVKSQRFLASKHHRRLPRSPRFARAGGMTSAGRVRDSSPPKITGGSPVPPRCARDSPPRLGWAGSARAVGMTSAVQASDSSPCPKAGLGMTYAGCIPGINSVRSRRRSALPGPPLRQTRPASNSAARPRAPLPDAGGLLRSIRPRPQRWPRARSI